MPSAESRKARSSAGPVPLLQREREQRGQHGQRDDRVQWVRRSMKRSQGSKIVHRMSMSGRFDAIASVAVVPAPNRRERPLRATPMPIRVWARLSNANVLAGPPSGGHNVPPGNGSAL